MDPDSYLCQLANAFTEVAVNTPEAGSVAALVLAALLLVASGFVSASEVAFFSLSPSDMNEINERKSKADARVSELIDDSEKLLATILISNNFVNVLIIMLCNYAFGQIFDFASPFAEFIIMTVVLTFLLLLFGEIMPKIYSVQNTLKFSRIAAPIMIVLKKVFSSLAWILVRSSFFINKSITKKKHNISVDELSQALELTDKEEISNENNILEGIIRFGEESVREVMTPRLDMVDIDIKASFRELLDLIVENVYSRIPVYSGSRDEIKGIVYIKDMLPFLEKPDNFKWQTLIRPAFFVPESKKIDELLREFQSNKVHIAIVVDEFGGTSGLITMEDIIEEIVGDIRDEYDDDEKLYVRQNDNTYIFESKILLTDLYKVLDEEPEYFEEYAGDSDTLAGLLLEVKGEFPALHEHIKIGKYDFEILAIDKRRIKKVKLVINEKE